MNDYSKHIDQINHLVQTDHWGHEVHMDLIYDLEDLTMMAIMGDVAMYPGGVQTVNFHDYQTVMY